MMSCGSSKSVEVAVEKVPLTDVAEDTKIFTRVGDNLAYSGVMSTEAAAKVAPYFKSWLFVAPECDNNEMEVKAEGTNFHIVHVPSSDLTHDIAKQVTTALRYLQAPVMVQCRSGTRASACLALHMADIEGWGAEEVQAWAESHSLPYATSDKWRNWVNGVAAETHESVSYTRPAESVVFRQLFDRETCTYTYVLGCAATKACILIDPVDTLVDRDLSIIEELGLTLQYGANTHVHADHVTGTGELKKKVEGVKSVISAVSGAVGDVKVAHGDVVAVGTSIKLEVRETPGHTDGCVTYVLKGHGMAFTGDTLLIRGCGRTDFQQGSNEKLYHSVHSQIFTLPPSTILYPAHDYKGRTKTTVAEERAHNPRLTKPLEEFKAIMDGLGLAYPKKIDVAVPANMKCGVYEVEEGGSGAEETKE